MRTTVGPHCPSKDSPSSDPWTDTQDGLFLVDGELEFVTLAPDGHTLAWGVSEGTDGTGRLTIFDLHRQAVVFNFVDHRQFASFSAVAFPSERYVLLARSCEVVAIERATNEITKLVELTDGSARSIAVSPDGNRLALGVVEWNGSGRVELFDLVFDDAGPRLERKRLANTQHAHPVRRVAFSPNGKYLGSADGDGRVIVGDAFTGETRQVLSVPGQEGDRSELGYSLAFSPDSSLLAAGGTRGVVLWDVKTGSRRVLPARNPRNITAVAFSQDGEFIASGSTDGIRIWHVGEGWQAERVLQGHDGNVITDLVFVRGSRVLITSGFDRRIRVVNLGQLKRSRNEE
jgi:WD40 repeat protein